MHKYALTVVMGCLLASGCATNKGRLAGVGAMTGAMAGAAIGKDAKAAAIGTAIGGITGAAVGEGLDEQQARNEALIAQQMGQRIEGATTTQQIIAMSQSGLSDSVIATHINTYGVAAPPSVQDLITLRQAGVSDAVLQAMQTSGVPRVAAAPPVIVQERVISPVVHVPVRPRRPCRPRYRRPGVSWGFSWSN